MRTAYIQAIAMAWSPLEGAVSSGKAKEIRFLWTAPVNCELSRETKSWMRAFYQESLKANLRCLARNVCKEISAGLPLYNGTIICNECSFFWGMSLQELKLLNQAVHEAGNYQRLADKFERTNGLSGHFAEFEADGEWREVFVEQKASQAIAVKELREKAVTAEKLEKEEKEDRRMEEQIKKKSGGPVGICEVFLNGASVWRETCHWSVARKKIRDIKAKAGERDIIELYEGGKKIPSEKWSKAPAQKKSKITSREEGPKETTTEAEKEISVPLSFLYS